MLPDAGCAAVCIGDAITTWGSFIPEDMVNLPGRLVFLPSFLYRVRIVILTISQLRSMIACLHMTCESRLGFLDALGRFQQPETGWKFVYRVSR
jgi:hypothetical protein